MSRRLRVFLRPLPKAKIRPYETFKPYAEDSKNARFTHLGGKAGDIIIPHELLPHSSSPNQRHNARVITNPHVCLKGHFNLKRPDGNYASAGSCRGAHSPLTTPSLRPYPNK